MTLVEEIKLKSLIVGQLTLSMCNRSDHMNDKQSSARLSQLSLRDGDENLARCQAIHCQGSNKFRKWTDPSRLRALVSLSEMF